MATTKTLISNLNSLLCNGCISEAEHKRIKTRIIKAEAEREEAAIVAEITTNLTAFAVPGTAYAISDLVKEVMGISAPCHGIKETKEEQKYRDGIAKPRMKAAIAALGEMVTVTGSGAQTRYLFNGELPEVVEAMDELAQDEAQDGEAQDSSDTEA